MINQDFHCHYSGSLSWEYIYGCMMAKGVKLITFAEFVKNYKVKWSGLDWKYNYRKFFELYKQIQKLTKSDVSEEQYDLYRSGAKDIALNYFKDEVDRFQLRIGPRFDFGETKNRIDALINGFESVESKFHNKHGYLVLTLIQDENGKFTNINDHTFEKIFALFSKKKYSDRIVGFDFSGPEINRDFDTTFKYIKLINDYNRLQFKKNVDSKVEVMVHAGEYVDLENPWLSLDNIMKLLDLNIDRLSHGTTCWIDTIFFDSSIRKSVMDYQNAILKRVGRDKTILEICPTANILMSPLLSIGRIGKERFEENHIRYTISTDNKTIFNTSLREEAVKLV